MRTLAIDYGSRRVGLALSDQNAKLATPYDVLQISSPKQATDLILAIIKKEGIERLVIGLPINMDDTHGLAAKTTITWAKELSARSNLPIIFVDERLSSFAAEQDLNDRKLRRREINEKAEKERLDAIVAANLLQSFLDGRLPEIHVS